MVDEQVCAICMDVSCNHVLRCGHMFHEACIAKWAARFQERNDVTCPFCRRSACMNEDIKYILGKKYYVKNKQAPFHFEGILVGVSFKLHDDIVAFDCIFNDANGDHAYCVAEEFFHIMPIESC
jgi:hypothetical protein